MLYDGWVCQSHLNPISNQPNFFGLIRVGFKVNLNRPMPTLCCKIPDFDLEHIMSRFCSNKCILALSFVVGYSLKERNHCPWTSSFHARNWRRKIWTGFYHMILQQVITFWILFIRMCMLCSVYMLCICFLFFLYISFFSIVFLQHVHPFVNLFH